MTMVNMFTNLTAQEREMIAVATQRVIDANPNAPGSDILRAQMMMIEGRFAEAEAMLHSVAESEDRSLRATAYSFLGLMYVEMGKYDQARQAYEMAESQNVASVRAITSQADVCWSEGDIERAEALYKRALDVTEEYDPFGVPSAAHGYAQCLVKRGHKEEAVAMLEQLIRRFPNESRLHEVLDYLRQS